MGRELGVIASLFILLLTGVSARASVLNCATSASSCDFYRCLEHEKKCGSNGYPIAFGDRLCERYRQVEARSSYRLRKWYPRVRECLQQAVAEIADPLSCGELEKQAFESHLSCYLETGFCDLSFGDKLNVLRVAGADALHPETLKVSLKIAATCDQWKSMQDSDRLLMVKDGNLREKLNLDPKVEVDVDSLLDDSVVDSESN